MEKPACAGQMFLRAVIITKRREVYKRTRLLPQKRTDTKVENPLFFVDSLFLTLREPMFFRIMHRTQRAFERDMEKRTFV